MSFTRLIITLVLVEASLGARILGLFPTASFSHQVVFHALELELARRGHELVVLTTDAVQHHPNITEINAHDLAYPLINEVILSKVFEAERTGKRSLLNQYVTFMDYQRDIFKVMMDLPEVREMVQSKSEKFDLILVESISRPMFAFRHKFKVPVIAVSSLGCLGYTYDAVGVPTHPLFYQDMLAKRNTNFNVMGKAMAIYDYLFKYLFSIQFEKEINELARTYFGEDTPDISELEAQTDMLFINVNPIWDGIKSTPPNVYYMYGGHLTPPKDLPADLKRFLDNSTRGVVYMSLGSNIKSTELRPDRLNVFLETFRHLPYDVLWKWEAEDLPGKPDNVRIAKWLPQANLLKHPNVKAFIMQGGLQSTDEALQAGVPLIGIPFFADQEANTERYEIHGVGIKLDLQTITPTTLGNAVKAVAEGEKYRTAVRRIVGLLADGGVAGGVERAAWWVEYVIRHGGAQHLRSPAAGVSAIEYFMLDVVAAFVLVFAIGLALLWTAYLYIFSPLMSTYIRPAHKLKSQ